MSQHYAIHLPPVEHAVATGAARTVLDQALAQVGFIPNMYRNMANQPALLDTYLHGYAAFRKDSGLSPAEQEVVFLTISRINGCRYCVAAHSMLADRMSGVPAPVTDAIRAGTAVPDARLAALHAFTAEMVRTAGRPSVAAARAFLDAGYTERHMLDVVLAIAVKTLSNFSNHLFNTPVDEMFAGRRWEAAA